MGGVVEQTVVGKTLNTLQGVAASTAVAGGFWAFMNENSAAVGALVGVGAAVIGLLTFCVNWMYKHKHYKLEERMAMDTLRKLVREEVELELHHGQ